MLMPPDRRVPVCGVWPRSNPPLEAAYEELEMDRTAESQTEALAGPLQAPESVPDVGVPKNFLEDLVLKILYLAGPLWLLELAERTRLSVRVIDELFRRLRKEQLCEVTGM